MLKQKMPASKDKKIFKRTAKKVKAVNLTSNVKRGGIRL